MVQTDIRKFVQAVVLVAMCVVFYLNKSSDATTPAGSPRLASNSYLESRPASESTDNTIRNMTTPPLQPAKLAQ